MDEDTLAEIAAQLRDRVREEDAEANAKWLTEQLPDPADWFRLNFVLAAAVPTSSWLKLTEWTRPRHDPRLVDEIAVERACHGEKVPLTRVEMVAAVHRLSKRGVGLTEIAERLNLPPRTVSRYRATRGRVA